MYIVAKNGYGYLSLMGVYSDAAAIEQALDAKLTSTDEYGRMHFSTNSFWATLDAYPATLNQEMGDFGYPANGCGVLVAEWEMED